MKERPSRPRPALHEEASFLALADALPHLVALIRGDEVLYLNPAGSALLGGPFALPPQAGTQRVRRPDGRDLWIDFTVESLELEGEPATLVTGHDVTETKKVEEALRKSEALFRGLYTHTPTVMWAVDYDGRYREVSDALLEKLGYTREEILGTDSRNQLTPESLQRLLEMNARGLEAKDWWTRDFPLQVVRKDGQVLDIQFSGVPELDEHGSPQGWLCVATDFTEVNRAQRELRSSEERFRSAFENAAVGKAIVSPDFRFKQVNRAYCDMFGYAEDELLEMSPNELTHPDDTGESAALLARLLAGECSSGRVFKLYRKQDGQKVWGDQTLTLLRDGEGKPAFFIGEIVDVTERMRAEELLRDREAKLAEAQRIAHIGHWEHDIAADRSTWSEEFYRIGEVDPALVHPSKEEFFRRLHPEDRLRVAALVERAIQDASPYEFEARIVLERGAVKWIHSIARVDKDASGKAARIYGVAQDVTARKRSQEALRMSDERFRAAFENAAIGKAITAPDMRFLQVNRAFCEMLGSTETELLASSPIDLTHPEDREESRELVARLVRGDATSDRMVKRYLHKSGKVVWGDLTTTIVRDAAGEASYFVSEIIDVTERKHAEELLRDREAKLAEAQRVAHLGSWEYDIESRRSIWSDEMYRIFRLDPARFDPSSHSAIPRIHPEDVARSGELVQQTIRDGTPYEYEFRIVLDDGEVRSLWTIGRAELGPDRKPSRVYGIVQDITERKRAEEALRASEQRFRNLYTQAPVLMTVVGPDGRIREVSNYWLARFGYQREEVIGREARTFVPPEVQARLMAALDESVARGDHAVRNLPLVGLRKDGTTVDALVTALLEFDEKKQFLGLVTVGLDVTDMRRAEEALRESEARYRALVQHAPEAIVVADGDNGKFVDVNEQAVRLFRRTREELLSLGPADCSPPFQPNGRPSPEMAQDLILRTAVETQNFEWTHLDGEGRDIPCFIRLSKMPDRTRNLIRATITDISQQKAMEAKLRQDDRMAAIGVLSAGVAHEIGNPLLALSMAAQSLQRKAKDEYSAKKLTLIREHIDRISKIVRQMSDLARAPAQERSKVDLNRVLERSLEVVRYDKRARQVAIEVNTCGDRSVVEAAEDQLVQVCLNLALNALDAVAANPPDRPKSLRIGVRCLERDGRNFVRAEFRDSGPGIPEAARSRIFQPFFTTKEPGKGTGLGLSVSYRIIEEHQGKLGFDTDPARGTEFFFELPMHKNP